jgi:thiamine-phosphate pyrophosphorylase
MIGGGSTFIQLREKVAAPGEWIDDAIAAVRFAKAAGVRIIVNDRVDLAIAADADGVHLGQDDLPPRVARKLLGKGAIIGLSTHSLEQIREAVEMPVDYIGVGPIFDTSSKKNPDPSVGLRLIEQAKHEIGDLPLVAIGGIGPTNVDKVFAAGADAVAMIGAILSFNGEISKTIRELELRLC